jgi:hypothetical protein
MKWYWNFYFIYENGAGWRLYGLHILNVFIGVSIELRPSDDKI